MNVSALQIEMDMSVLDTLQTTLKERPINTKRKYKTYQNEYMKWCQSKGFLDGQTVTAGKLHLFLSSEVIGRANKKK
jgi:hypothetical protein